MTIYEILTDSGYLALKERVLDHTGLHYYADKDEDFAARVGRRIAATNAPGCAAYRRILEERGPHGEYEHLIGELTIGETYFFRQSEHFDLLRTRIIPHILERNAPSRTLRIWSAGCATGAEPYSISLLLERDFAPLLHGWDVRILGTDLNADFLQRARAAVFGQWALRDVPPQLRSGCFEPHGKMWKLRPQYAKGVAFERHNLAGAESYPGESGEPFDVILCRNVLIYFSNERIRSVVSRLHNSLAQDGWLLVGHAEMTVPAFESFTVHLEHGAAAFRKGDGAPPQPAAWLPQPIPLPRPSPKQPPRPAPSPIPAPPAVPAKPEGLHDVLLMAGSGDWKSAEKLCLRLIEADPLNAANHFTLGLILEHVSSSQDAEASFRRSIYLDRSFALAHYHLGCCLQHNGESRQARKSFQNVLTILKDHAGDEQVIGGEGIAVDELRDLCLMHLRLLL